MAKISPDLLDETCWWFWDKLEPKNNQVLYFKSFYLLLKIPKYIDFYFISQEQIFYC